MRTETQATDLVCAAVTRRVDDTTTVGGCGVFTVECRGADGQLKWAEEIPNLVVNVGLADMNDRYFRGAAYTAAWFVGLYGASGTNTPAAGDTMASRPGWTEATPYSNATRPAAVFGAPTVAQPSVISNAASPAVFNINATATVGGAFLVSNNVRGGTTGTLFSAAPFAAPGNRSVVAGDAITVTYTFSLQAL